ncbi:hypothetical protein Y032_0028g1823 [Ancylostoma ceylanicum]|uniref:Uncharacterized protein n=1 Tax=Ancylostoma ceylanicum TaxID=53326 RepID=A0A016UU66_9BILA|nr:hypothetical protein Y032_0028g1822 [Ancylostoma ceylanicum]EYC18368.1 hypothetical protein Y032_0028g1823 [Ancylostoma ceylanicum]
MTTPTEAVVIVVGVRSDRRTKVRNDPRRNPTHRIPTSIDAHGLMSDRAGVRRTLYSGECALGTQPERRNASGRNASSNGSQLLPFSPPLLLQ